MNDIKGIIEDVEKSSLVSNKVVKKVIEIIGQEKWNDIYDEEDDTCTTTGELIITLKGIAEFEKENAELKKRNAELKGMYAHSAREAGTYKQFLEAKEKENAELKEKYAKNITDCDICDTYCNSQLTKAKELLERLLITSCNSDVLNLLPNCSEVLRMRVEAEQFLKETK